MSSLVSKDRKVRENNNLQLSWISQHGGLIWVEGQLQAWIKKIPIFRGKARQAMGGPVMADHGWPSLGPSTRRLLGVKTQPFACQTMAVG